MPALVAGDLVQNFTLLVASSAPTYARATHVPSAARQLVRDFGILLFSGETGFVAGANLMEGLRAAPGATILGAALIIVVTVVSSLAIAVKILRLKSLDSWGSLGGAVDVISRASITQPDSRLS